MSNSDMGMHDKLILHVVHNHPHIAGSIKDKILGRSGGHSNLFRSFLLALPGLPSDLAEELLDRLMSCAVIESALSLVVHRSNGQAEDRGVVDTRVVTTAGVTYLANASGHSLYDFNFHGLGTGAVAPAAGDTALGAEIASGNFSTSYRPAGTQSNAAVSANWKYTSVATNTASAAIAPTEMGLFTAASAGTLLDRFTFGAVNMASGDSLETTVAITLNSGG